MTGLAIAPINALGSSFYTNSSVGTTPSVIVAAGANLRGVRIRTLTMAGSGGGFTWLTINSNLIFEVVTTGQINTFPMPLLVAPGLAVAVACNIAASGQIWMSYDVL